MTIFTNNGQGSFAFAGKVAVDSHPAWIAAADIYGNGKTDLISSSASQHTLTMTTNTGSGFLSNANYTISGQPYYFAAGDINGDGKPDLVALDYEGDGHSSGTFTVLTNNGSGAFVTAWNSGTVEPYPHSVSIADFNGDGKSDFAAVEYYASPQVLVYTNAGKGQFANAVNVGVSGNGIYAIAADFNGDGKPDLAVADSSSTSGLTIYTNNGAGSFAMRASYSIGAASFFTAADVNGDGKLDIVATLSASNTVAVLTNDGSGGFALESTLSPGFSPTSVAVADFNGDGVADLAVAGSGTNALIIYLGAAAQPEIFSFTPTTGVPGTIVSITGTNFLNTTNVTFNGITAAFTVNSNSQITATVPGNATTGPIGVFTTNGIAYSASNFVIGYAPGILGQPTNLSVEIGQPASFSVVASGSSPLIFQWQKNGANLADGGSLSGSSASNLTINSTAFTDSGFYRVVVTNSFGAVTSAAAGLSVDLSSTNSITFNADAVIILPATEIISSNLTINGTGHNVIISGNTNVGVFNVESGVQFTLQAVTIANGSVTNSGAGIINNGGTVSLNNCTLSNNQAAARGGADAAGGAIYNMGAFATLILNNCTFANNRAVGGTGISGTNGASEYAAGSTGGNGGTGRGGAIANESGANVIVTNCTFYSNQAIGGNGGSGGNGYNGYMYYFCCQYNFFGNCIGECPAYVYGGPGGNGGSGGYGYGGSIYNNSGNISFMAATFANSSAIGGYGGAPGLNGAYDQSGSGVTGFSGSGFGGNLAEDAGQLFFKNSIVANAAAGGNFSGGSVVDDGNNLSSDASLTFTNATSLTNANPNLALLANNGGPTMTMALQPASPAIRAGDTNGAPQTDQRGFPRKPLAIDMGAFETQIVTSVIPPVLTGSIPTTASNYEFEIAFTNSPGASFSLWSATNLSSPSSDWLWLGYPRETAPGQFQFNDLNLTNSSQKFYRVTSP